MTAGKWPHFLEKPLTPLWRNLLVLAVLSWMAFYPIYTSYYKANAVEHYLRHLDHIAGDSWFFNPWQYRILCPIIIECLYWVFDHTLFAIWHVKGIDLGLPGDQQEKNQVTQKLVVYLKDPEFIKYTLVFVFFRFVQNLTILWLLFKYLSLFVKNKSLVALGMMMAFLFMGNSVVDSDFTFNTYMDVILYLLAGIVIVNNYNAWWIVVLTIIGAMNRETSVFIPVIYFFSKFSWTSWPSIPNLVKNNIQPVIITSVCAVLFVSIFVAIRVYYGYQPQSTWRVPAGWPMLKLNLFSSVSIKTYMEMFGVFGILPFWTILVYKRMDSRLRLLFLSLVPVWFVLHITTGIGYQTRLFLVPTFLVFIPVVLESLEKSYLEPAAVNA